VSEFSGVQPTGANALLAAMNGDKATLPGLVSAVRAGAAQAGSDLDEQARAADQVLHAAPR
jgi:hypothetical protein